MKCRIINTVLLTVVLTITASVVFSAAVAVATHTTKIYEKTVYQSTVVSVYDGDTMDVRVNIWPGIETEATIRIYGLDTPEIRTRSACEKVLGYKAKETLIQLFTDDKTVYLTDVKHGSFGGRYVATVTLPDGRTIPEVMITAGLAVPYYGESKTKVWCEDTDL